MALLGRLRRGEARGQPGRVGTMTIADDASFLEMLDILNSDVGGYIEQKIVASGRLDTYVEQIKQHKTDPYTVVAEVVREMLK
mgnify:CR=1 FL=1